MLNNKKKLIMYIVIAVIIVVAIATGTVFLLKSSNNKKDTTQVQTAPTKATIDALKVEAEKIMLSNPTKAKTMLEQARQQYKDINNTNGVSDVDQLLYTIDHPINKK